jgi:prevent-host-death family protein
MMGSQSWTVAEAKAKFSEIIEKAMSEGPQTITRKGRTAAVVVGQRMATKDKTRWQPGRIFCRISPARIGS